MISSLFLFGGIQNGALLVIAQGKLCLLLHIHNDWNFPISNFYRNFRNLTFKVVRKSGVQLALSCHRAAARSSRPSGVRPR